MKKIKTFTHGSYFYAVCIVTNDNKVVVKYYTFAGNESNEVTEWPKDQASIGFAALNRLYQEIKIWAANQGLIFYHSK